MKLGWKLLLFLLIIHPAWARSRHYSFWSDDPKPYLRAIQMSSRMPHVAEQAGESIRAGIVTHHFLASGLMVRFFEELRSQSSPDIIILMGPNHFHHGLANISISSLPWKTPFGLLQTDRRITRRLRIAIGLPEDPEAFTGEHSVGVLVPFLRYYFPGTRVVPILVDVNAQPSRLRKLRTALASLLRNPRVVVLLSMDFSHDSIASIADSRDEQAQRAISALDASSASGLHVDCRRGLWLLLASLHDLGHVRAQIKEHTNSAQLSGHLSQPDVTSYFTVFFLS
jgi:AmmeMemoRadiSam system protein B